MKKRGKEVYITAIGLLLMFGLSACAAIPNESADLSIELGKRISAIEVAHMVLVDKYFDEKRSRIDEFVEKEWVPEFAAQFFANQQISSLTRMTDAEIKELFPKAADAKQLVALMKIVKAAETRNKKISNIVENSEKFAGIVLTLLDKYL